LTGGEPLIYEEALPLVYELQSLGYNVSIETSGCIPLEEPSYRRSYKYVMDIKGPSSGVKHKNVYDNLLKLQNNDEVKYVIKDRADYEFMKDVMKKYPTSAKILVSPMFDPDGKPYIGKELVEWIIEDHLDVRVSLQIHKFLEVQ
jgi:7-carboxy-7-deazaguanine synthase